MPKKTLAALLLCLFFYSANAQDFATVAGDWIRVRAEYQDGEQLPRNHGSRIFVRYVFTGKELYLVFPGSTIVTTYSRAGNHLKIAPVQEFIIEQYTESEITLLDATGDDPIRYHLIPTHVFQTNGTVKYSHEVVNADTVYANAHGIEPIYKKGNQAFMMELMSGFTQEVGFNFSYVVQKDGTIGDITINASTNPKLDKRLTQLIRKSSGKWIPATYKGQPINVRLKESVGFNRNN
ncbi:MAG TPA: hypothetical protein VGD65_06165 [Chryseosolibacter sp.]